jgi:glycyl-tRNA synthetase
MFATQRGVTQNGQNTVYLRPENAQGEYVNFLNVLRSMRTKLPYSIGQIGKAFRNEITPGNFTFRTIEFEQMEYQTFCKQGDDEGLYEYFKDYGIRFFEAIGLSREHLRFHNHDKLAHYAKAACDIEYLFPFGWGELWGIADRTDFDLKQHIAHSGESLEYIDPETNERFVPYCIEPSLGADRVALAFLCDAYDEEPLENEMRVVLHLHPALAPYKAAVLPLQKKLAEKADEIYVNLLKHHNVDYDLSGSIGKRYRRQDEIGTPYCFTVDFETLEDGCVTVRDRDTMLQTRLPIEHLAAYLDEKVNF